MRRTLFFSIYFWTTVAICDQGPEIRYQYLHLAGDPPTEGVVNAVSTHGLTHHFDWLRVHDYVAEIETESSSSEMGIRIVFEYVEPKALPHVLALLELYNYRAVMGVTSDWLTKVAESEDPNLNLALRQLISTERIVFALDLQRHVTSQSPTSSQQPFGLLSGNNDPAKMVLAANEVRQLVHRRYNMDLSHVLWPAAYYNVGLAGRLTKRNFTKHIWSHRYDKWRVGTNERIGLLISGNRLADLVSMLETPSVYLHRGIQTVGRENNGDLFKVAREANLNAAWSYEQGAPMTKIAIAGSGRNRVDWYAEVDSLSSLESINYSSLTRGVSAVTNQRGIALQAWAESVAGSVAQKNPTTFVGATVTLNEDALLATALQIESRTLDFVVLDTAIVDAQSCADTELIVQSFTSSTNLGALDRARLVFRIDIDEVNVDSRANCIERLRYAGARSMIVRSATLSSDVVRAVKRTISLKSLPNELFIETQP